MNIRSFSFTKQCVVLAAFFIAVFVFCPKITQAATFYVNHTLGTDDVSHGTGIDTNAWATLKYALQGSRVSKGDTIYVQEGTWAEDQITVAVGAGDGTAVTVKNYGTDEVTIQTGTVTLGLLTVNSIDMVIDGINIDNNDVAMGGKFLFRLYATGGDVSLVYQNGTIDGSNPSGYIRPFQLAGTGGNFELTINKAEIINGGYVIDAAQSAACTNTVNIYSSVISESYQFFNANQYGPTDLTLLNNLFARAGARFFYLYPAGTEVVARNNIFLAGGSYVDIIWDLGGTFGEDAIADNSIFDVTYNYYYSEDETFTGLGTYIDIVKTNTVVPYIPIQNWFVNPSFTTIGSDYTLQAGSLVAGRGTAQHPPDGTDINGVAYGTNDVGPYANPALTALPTLSGDTIAWYGDSIMLGTGASTGDTTGASVFEDNTGETVQNYGVGGHMTKYQFWTIDQSIWTGREATAIIAIGINDLQAPRSAQTNAQVSDMIIRILHKLDAAGIEPISMGMSSFYGTPPDNTAVDEIVDSVQTECTAEGWTCGSILDQMRNNVDWAEDYYDDISIDVHPNDAGHANIGRLAEYLYYPRYTIGTDEVDIGADIRIFADGSYRNIGTPSGTTADFTVSPVGGVGSYDADDVSAYLDVEITTWDTSGNKNKAWTASSSAGDGYSHAGSTVYTIGDLLPNARYQFKLDGVASTSITGDTCFASICTADSSGLLTFTYTGGYSSHTFALTKMASSSVAATAPIPSLDELRVLKISQTNDDVCALGFTPGDDIQLRWSYQSVNLVNLYYVTDDGETTKIAGPITNTGSYLWTIPNDLQASTLHIKIEGTDLARVIASAEIGPCLLSGTTEEEMVPSDESKEMQDQKQVRQGRSPVTGEMEDLTDISVGDFIKGPSFPTIYYLEEDQATNLLIRRPFLDAQTFFTYQDDFSNIKVVTDATLTTIPLGSPMLPNPGVVLIKIQSDPKVYAIDADGQTIHWIQTEQVATDLYGQDWSQYIIDIDATFFPRFQRGTDVQDPDDIDLPDMSMKKREALR